MNCLIKPVVAMAILFNAVPALADGPCQSINGFAPKDERCVHDGNAYLAPRTDEDQGTLFGGGLKEARDICQSKNLALATPEEYQEFFAAGGFEAMQLPVDELYWASSPENLPLMYFPGQEGALSVATKTKGAALCIDSNDEEWDAEDDFLPENWPVVYYSNLTSYQPRLVGDLDEMKPIVNEETACVVIYNPPRVRVACGKNKSLIHRAKFDCKTSGDCSLVSGTGSPYFPQTIQFGKGSLKGIIPGKLMFMADGWDLVFGREGLHRYEIPVEDADLQTADHVRMAKACGYENSNWLSHSVVKRVVEPGKTVYSYQCGAAGIEKCIGVFRD